MNNIYSLVLLALIFTSCVSSCRNNQYENASTKLNAGIGVSPKPPMGWNSFDAYDCVIDEQQFRSIVDYMSDNLLEYGWEYAVLDFGWYNPNPGAWNNPDRRFGHPDLMLDENGVPIEKLAMDEYGRLLPAIERFPSALDGKGFKTLADYVHEKGLKFGIHIMRGIPRQAYYENLQIKGSQSTAKDIGEPWDQCTWNNNMFGIDFEKDGAQEYYNSIFELYADWGVDFIKADDMMFFPYHEKEIEMIHNAIINCKKPMVLSLSCGPAPMSMANHLVKYSNMWRISADFWDNWESLEKNFELLGNWSPFISRNHWPDGDMLPVGKLALNNRPKGIERMSNFTWDEHFTLMTLWSIAKSPLMIGGDLLSMDDTTLSYLTNEEVLYINQNSTDNQQIRLSKGIGIWMASDPANGDSFLALFNLTNQKADITFNFEIKHMRHEYNIRDLWLHQDLGLFSSAFTQTINPHGSGLYRISKVEE